MMDRLHNILLSILFTIGIFAFIFLLYASITDKRRDLTCVQSVVHNDKAVCAVYINKELKK